MMLTFLLSPAYNIQGKELNFSMKIDQMLLQAIQLKNTSLVNMDTDNKLPNSLFLHALISSFV